MRNVASSKLAANLVSMVINMDQFKRLFVLAIVVAGFTPMLLFVIIPAGKNWYDFNMTPIYSKEYIANKSRRELEQLILIQNELCPKYLKDLANNATSSDDLLKPSGCEDWKNPEDHARKMRQKFIDSRR